MKLKKTTVFIVLMITNICVSNAQNRENPLEQLSFYIGTWGLPNDDPFIQKRPNLKDLKVIDFEWGSDKRLIHSRTGIYAKNDTIMFSEGIITYNPTTSKLEWLEFQIDGNLLFQGEYRIMGSGKVQRSILYITRKVIKPSLTQR
ncbi:hypothetical protein [Maribacter halichondriae]|uniref:hypothetical protein n=1 Tax=Maribacter halichondriae TaxID=2980554 RepID=UPI002359F1D3|nr:hypothetical protein [Maribacter sp. Hal144]